MARSKEREVGKRLLEVFALCSDAGETVGDATERALYGFCENCGVSPEHLRRRYPRKGEIPFDSDRKRMTTVHEQGENWISCVKGAPDVILKRCRYEMEEDKIVPLTRRRRSRVCPRVPCEYSRGRIGSFKQEKCRMESGRNRWDSWSRTWYFWVWQA